MKFNEIFVLLSAIASLIIGIKYRLLLRTNVSKFYPYVIIGVILILASSAYYTILGATLENNGWVALTNLTVFIRNLIFALIGLILFKLSENEIPKFQPWEDGFKFLHNVPISYLVSIIIGITIYTYVILYFLKPEYLGKKELDTYQFIGAMILAGLAALNEELLFRMYIIGILVSIFTKLQFKWWFAIILSSFLWGYFHLPFANMGWIKFFQVFPLGLALGYTLKRYGFETCVFLHVAYNLTMLISSQIV